MESMKPYLREKNLKAYGKWKVDRHIRPKNKWMNWWEDDFDNFISRKTMKQNLMKEIEKDLFF